MSIITIREQPAAAHKKAGGRSGFTLIQLSIILAVASLVMVAVLPSSQNTLTANNASTSKLNTIFSTMRAFEAANGYLPCPADPKYGMTNASYGVSAAGGGSTGNCNSGSPAANFVDATNHVAVGMVPVRALGLSNDFAIDGYGRDITYAVDTNATSCWASSSLVGQITVADNNAYNTTVAALISHGADGHGAYLPSTGNGSTLTRMNAGSTDTDELVNAHITTGTFPTAASSSLLVWSGGGSNKTTFVKKPFTSTFDDIVVYNSPLWNINTIPTALVGNSPVMTTQPANGSYASGTLVFKLTFPSAVTVTGTPRLLLTALGNGTVGASGTGYATYNSGASTSTVLEFDYTLLSTDNAPGGITLSNLIDINGGSIKQNSTANSACPLTFSAPNLAGVVIIYGYLYVADLGNNVIQKYTTAGSFVGTVGAAAPGGLSEPFGLATDASHDIFVADQGHDRVVEFSSAGSYIKSFGQGYNGIAACSDSNPGTCTGNGQMSTPESVILDNAGLNIWVADQNNYRMQEFNISTGHYVAKFSGPCAGVTPGNYTDAWNPPACTATNNDYFVHAAVDGSGNLWITDMVMNRVQEWTTGGSHITNICSQGTGNNQLLNPEGIAYSGSKFYVADLANNRINVINSSCVQQFSVGSTGYANGQLNGPAGVNIDSNGNIWVADSNNYRVEEFSASGSFIQSIGGTSNTDTCRTAPTGSPACASGSAPGQLGYPTDIIFSPQ